MNELIILIVVLLICQFVNVLLNTIKTLVTVRGGAWASAIMNAITYGFYAVIVQQTSSNNLIIVVPITIVSNLIAVPLSFWIMSKFRKDKLWEIKTKVSKELVDMVYIDMANCGIEVMANSDVFTGDFIVTFLSKTQSDSVIVFDYVKANHLQMLSSKVCN